MGRRHAIGAALVLGLLAGGVALVRPPGGEPSGASSPSSGGAAFAVSPREPLVPAHPTAYLPPQCYAAPQRTPEGRTHQGCFTCHQTSRAPNYTDDADVQTVLSVPRAAEENHWLHLLNPPRPVELPEAELLAWIRSSNYVDERGGLRLAEALAHPPASWDGDGNGRWDGYTPDCWFHPDEEGFDHSPEGALTGWRAFAYAPFPGMFWPTHGSAGDVFIRLPEAFRRDREGHERLDLYRINLAILEAFIRRESVPIPPTDERALGSDLDGDGVLGRATRVAFVWPPRPGRPLSYVGQAATLEPAREGWPAAGLFPRGTEFLHSLRYLDVDGGRVRMAARMKELRYMRKVRWMTYSDLELAAGAEAREKQRHPDKLKTVLADAERGIGTGTGWRMQGFIEAADGTLRPQSVEETTACIGCHGGVGASTDSTFSFARKLAAGSAFHQGWYHWEQRGLQGLAEPRRADGQGEYAHWLAQVGGGDDYGGNDEVQARFFRRDGTLEPTALEALSRDISTLLLPSPRRALRLDRGYLALVRAQHFELGRDVVLEAAPRVKARLEQGASTGLGAPIEPAWRGPVHGASR